MGFLYTEFTNEVTPFGVFFIGLLIALALSLAILLVSGVYAWLEKKRAHNPKRIEKLTLLETDYQIMKLQEDPHWCESPIDVNKDKGFTVAKAKIQANIRARNQLFGNQFEVIDPESGIHPGIRV